MSCRAAYYFTALAVISVHNMIFPVKGQQTIQDCEKGDSSNSIVTEQNPEAIRLQRQLNDEVRSMRALLIESFQQLKNQQDSVLRRLGAIDRRLDEHEISVKNQTQNSWKLEIAYEIDLGKVPILVSTANDWIVLMHRFDGSLNFYRNWTEYRNGFGDIGRGEFWLGNEKVHRLTNRTGLAYSLRIEVQLDSSGRWFQADYATFSLDSEDNKYAIRLSGFSGNAGDSLTNPSLTGLLDGKSFSTLDADNDGADRSCAQSFKTGWWFSNCFHSCLTCQYGIEFKWVNVDSWQTSGLLRAARMMIKSR